MYISGTLNKVDVRITPRDYCVYIPYTCISIIHSEVKTTLSYTNVAKDAEI